MPVAVITGASKGLGRALGAALAARGWDLVVDARSAGPLEDAAGELRGAGVRVVALPGDVTDQGHREALVAAAGALGGLDLLVNNASALGAEPLARLADHPLDGLRAALEVNVVAPLGLVQEALPLLRNSSYLHSYEEVIPFTGNTPYIEDVENEASYDSHPYIENARNAGTSDSPTYEAVSGATIGAKGTFARTGGAVLNISSDAAVEAYPAWGGYGATKAALDQQSAVLAVEEPELRVWWVDPGDMRTDLYAAAVPDEDTSGRPLPRTVVPGLLRLLDDRAPSGRYHAAAGAGPSGGVPASDGGSSR
ncbi:MULTISPECIES: SDR family oxidoreductase [unclassified Streptomyces]|uniref:SDR family NAD(P)-dependent oxidoreductase n=1 Tax=unclassified Streptomyces TaxID=2593676 RepID=UPI0008878C3D|nr:MULTISPECIES: SDR family NAD(P)-dependent oxidoreductase [unclassified Streptomyces]PBC81655.1 short subunit dehydrogenase [Streptomyces sp. 2321.6]SDR53767.1 short chain dehydrogenase [Streptomyces sp. KS_16]SEC24768.1 short chain dehydrogenase [Streptomyces sp. 2133.1]SNC66105.1 short chain dehydrogenase [Streptomyces sp. 2114.4]